MLAQHLFGTYLKNQKKRTKENKREQTKQERTFCECSMHYNEANCQMTSQVIIYILPNFWENFKCVFLGREGNRGITSFFKRTEGGGGVIRN